MSHPYASKTPGRATAQKRYASGGGVEGTQGTTKGPGRAVQPTDLYDKEQLDRLKVGRKQGGAAK